MRIPAGTAKGPCRDFCLLSGKKLCFSRLEKIFLGEEWFFLMQFSQKAVIIPKIDVPTKARKKGNSGRIP